MRKQEEFVASALNQASHMTEYMRSALQYSKLVRRSKKRRGPCRGTRMYVLVRTNILPPAQRAVQACHAVAGYTDKFNNLKSTKVWARKHKTIIMLSSSDIENAKKTITRENKDIKYYAFKESDLGEYTALAFEPMIKKRGDDLFQGYLKMN